MVRRHDESGQRPGRWPGRRRAVVTTGHDDGPRDFVWRGRRYTVCAVLASWQERRAWWREVGDLRVGGQPGGSPGRALPSPQRRVWRVEAARPRAPPGSSTSASTTTAGSSCEPTTSS